MTEKPAEKPANEDSPAPSKPKVVDDPKLVAAKLDLDLAKIALERQRVGLNEQAERAKLLKEMTPDFSTVAAEKDASTKSDQPSALSDLFIQRAVYHVVDDIVDAVIHAVNQQPDQSATGNQPDHAATSWTFLVTSDDSHRGHVAAHRDISARLQRLQTAIARLAPDAAEPTDGPGRRIVDPVSIATAAFSALPGAITLATRLLANQYTMSSHKSAGAVGVDLHAAGALASKVSNDPKTTIHVRRLQPARNAALEQDILDLARSLDGRLSDKRSAARVSAAVASAKVGHLEARRTQLAKRGDEILAAWKDKVGKSAGSAGLLEDLALIKEFEAAIEGAKPDSPEAKRLSEVVKTVRGRVEAVLKEVSSGSGEMGTPELLEMVKALDEEDKLLAEVELLAKQAKAEADQVAAELDAVHAAGIEFLDSLGAADGSGERLLDKALLGAALSEPRTLILYVNMLHAGADGVDVLRAVRDDLRNLVFGATAEWALLSHEGAIIDAGVRTQIWYQQGDIEEPQNSKSGLIFGMLRPTVELDADSDSSTVE